MKRFSIRERESLSIGKTGDISEQEAEAFAQLAQHLPAGLLRWEHRAIRFGPFCGVLRAGEVLLELLPKIDNGFDQDDRARGLLVAMLYSAGALTTYKLAAASLSLQSAHLLDIFILDFCKEINLALRGGAIATYQEQTDNLNTLRGRLLLTDHLRFNALDQSQLLCAFDERTIDNKHNQALKAVLSQLLPVTLSAQTRAAITALLHRFDTVTGTVIRARDIDHLSFDRTMRHWESVFERAKWFLQGLFPDVRTGDVDGTCLLFNMERLFEKLLGLRIRRDWEDRAIGRYRVALQGPPRYLADSATGPKFELCPDISIWDNERVVAIFDAKWKRLDPDVPNFGVSPADVYQLTTYASRCDCQRVALVFPASRTVSAGEVAKFVLQVPDQPRLHIVAVDLCELTFNVSIPEVLRA